MSQAVGKRGNAKEGRHLFPKNRLVQTHPNPIKGYQKIKCIAEIRNLSHLCWQICGLTCAKNCDRFGDAICEGCPCLNSRGETKEIKHGDIILEGGIVTPDDPKERKVQEAGEKWREEHQKEIIGEEGD